jgi:uncharacterized membrane protein YgcG
MFRLILLCLIVSLSACGTTTEVTRTYQAPNGTPITETRKGSAATYGIYTDAVKAVAQSDAVRANNQRTPEESCARGDSVCGVAVAGFNAVAAMADALGHKLDLQPPARERDGAEKFRDVALGLTAIAVPLTNTYQNIQVSRYNRDQQLAVFGTLERVIQSNNQTTRDVLTAGPTIAVGGDYVTGQVGDNITGDGNAVAHDTGAANSGTTVAGDLTGRDHNDGSVVGDGNRVDSPSFDNVGNGGNGGSCAGGSGGTGGAAGEGSNGGAGAAGATGGNCSGGAPGDGG